MMRRMLCHLFGMHHWTSAVQQDAFQRVFSKEHLKRDPVGHFHFTARMWCLHCGKFSELNQDPSREPVPGCRPWNRHRGEVITAR